jgi:hypothetical protein
MSNIIFGGWARMPSKDRRRSWDEEPQWYINLNKKLNSLNPTQRALIATPILVLFAFAMVGLFVGLK